MKRLILTLSFIFSFSAFASTQLDDLIRGELAALKTYDVVIKDTKNKEEKQKLQAIRKNHSEAVSELSKHVADKPKLLEDTESAGVWGTFTKTWTKGAKLIGNTAALKALKQGEEHGINEYEEALEDETLNADIKEMIRNKMIPAQKKHIKELNRFM